MKKIILIGAILLVGTTAVLIAGNTGNSCPLCPQGTCCPADQCPSDDCCKK